MLTFVETASIVILLLGLAGVASIMKPWDLD